MTQTTESPTNPGRFIDKWLSYAERDAKLPKLVGGLWHPYRRKWAMERKHFPLADVAAVGGWKDIETMLRCYSQADRATMLGVMSAPKKLRVADVLGGNAHDTASIAALITHES